MIVHQGFPSTCWLGWEHEGWAHTLRKVIPHHSTPNDLMTEEVEGYHIPPPLPLLWQCLLCPFTDSGQREALSLYKAQITIICGWVLGSAPLVIVQPSVLAARTLAPALCSAPVRAPAPVPGQAPAQASAPALCPAAAPPPAGV